MTSPALVEVATVPSLDSLDEAVRSGLECDQERMTAAWDNENFFKLRNLQYIEKREAEDDVAFQQRPKRTSKLTRKVIRVLSENLYNPGPTRTPGHSAGVNTFLDGVWRDTHINALMQAADRAATLNAVAALQVEATGDPARPVKLSLWKAHELAVWCEPGDCSRPWAVCTKTVLPAVSGGGKLRTRYQLWGAAERRTYYTADYLPGLTTAGGRRADRYSPEESGPSPYPGVLPFVFVRNEPAAACDEFWDGGIGTALRECNRDLDRALSEIAEHVKEFLNPKAFLRNVTIQARFLERVGQFAHLKGTTASRQGDSPLEPDAFYLQAQLGVEQAWYDLKSYADSTLEELDVPCTVVRSDASTDLSGVAIVAKAIPLYNRTRARQPQFSETEEELAARVCAVVGTWHRQADLIAAARDPKLVCVWPEPAMPLPTPERDDADKYELEQGLTDPIEVLARRRGLTLAQAEEVARQIARRRATWEKLFAPAEPEVAVKQVDPEPDPADAGEGSEAPEPAGAED